MAAPPPSPEQYPNDHNTSNPTSGVNNFNNGPGNNYNSGAPNNFNYGPPPPPIPPPGVPANATTYTTTTTTTTSYGGAGLPPPLPPAGQAPAYGVQPMQQNFQQPPQQTQLAEFTPHPAIMHADPSVIRVRHRAAISQKFENWYYWNYLWDCGCCKSNEALRRTYFEVHENRVEYNYPIPCICCVIDKPNILFFDRDRARAVKRAGCCAPCWQHFPTCCDRCGEGIVMGAGPCCMCHRYHPNFMESTTPSLFQGFVSANVLVEEITKAKVDWLKRVGPSCGMK